MHKLVKNKKIIIPLILIILVIVFFVWREKSSKTTTPQYQTSVAQKETLISTVSASGNITSGNSLSISTEATGVIDKVYVKNGDTVKQGQTIATIILDQDAKQKQISAWASYLSTKNQLKTANDKLVSLQASAFKADQKFRDQAKSQGLSDQDPTYITQHTDMITTKNDYENQLESIKQMEVSLTSSGLSYQKLSTNIIAPATGTVSNLIIASGSVINQQSSSASNSSGTQTVGTIARQQNNLQASVSLTEIDVTKVVSGQKVTITLDAFADKTFTGKVLLVDTNGKTSSNVTSYPAIIGFDSDPGNIYSNMAISAKIITSVKDDVIIVPVAAIQTTNDQKTVRVLSDNQITSKTVEIGQSNGLQTEIISGINEGDIVVTSVVSSTKAASGTTSVFSGMSGGAMRMR